MRSADQVNLPAPPVHPRRFLKNHSESAVHKCSRVRRRAKRVDLLARCDDLGEDMSRYLLDRILALESNALAEIIERCCAIKARIVGLDERETGSGPRALLNLGHTFGHAIETHTGYTQWLHGEAVAAGLCLAADLSARHGWITEAVAARCITLIQRAGLPTQPPPGMTAADFRDLMGLDKKVQNGKLRLILMRGLGDAIISSDFDASLLDSVLHDACSAAG